MFIKFLISILRLLADPARVVGLLKCHLLADTQLSQKQAYALLNQGHSILFRSSIWMSVDPTEVMDFLMPSSC